MVLEEGVGSASFGSLSGAAHDVDEKSLDGGSGFDWRY